MAQLNSTLQQAEVLSIAISGMRCDGCVQHIREALLKLDGVQEVEVSLFPPQARLVSVRPLSLEQINGALAQAGGYQAEVSKMPAASPSVHPTLTLPVIEGAPITPAAGKLSFWQEPATWRRAALNTLNCLIGCSIGDFGFLIYAQASSLRWSMWMIMGVAMLCGLLTSVMMETVLLKLREKFDWKTAFQTALSMSFLSMLAMELAENLTDYALTGGMAVPSEPFFWIALLLSLLAGFLVPLPYNYFKLRKYNKSCH
ncbi:MAG: DUF4396 domain-containing protein [Chloroherpetonaceae bacterium]|nr:DUF4396 domain-containing protein [Chloroherpetonaceae bacterium]MCS7212074.1 DUF4396 domain-containing protein [Chloroherpetonaceae bacterium]MDW8018911.1 DUF4396 domain-containing protein [Chloroherpetonaceae bacterium]MDW8465016.1 DUF4396 domain-containing protein [Chloroherpetonaceae bacterium]